LIIRVRDFEDVPQGEPFFLAPIPMIGAPRGRAGDSQFPDDPDVPVEEIAPGRAGDSQFPDDPDVPFEPVGDQLVDYWIKDDPDRGAIPWRIDTDLQSPSDPALDPVAVVQPVTVPATGTSLITSAAPPAGIPDWAKIGIGAAILYVLSKRGR